MNRIPQPSSPAPKPSVEHYRERTGVARTHWLMQQAGFRPCVTPAVLHAVMSHCAPPESQPWLCLAAEQGLRSRLALVPKGLDELPLPWLKALPGIWQTLCDRNPRWLGTALGAVTFDAGVFRLASVQEVMLPPHQLTLFDRLRVELNARFYPSLWRPLKKEHERLVWRRHPELRPELFTV